MDGPTILNRDVFDLADKLLDAYPDVIPFEDFGLYRILSPIGRGDMGGVSFPPYAKRCDMPTPGA